MQPDQNEGHLWLRLLNGALILPFVWLGVVIVGWIALSAFFTVDASLIFFSLVRHQIIAFAPGVITAGLISWLIAQRLSLRSTVAVALACASLLTFGYWLTTLDYKMTASFDLRRLVPRFPWPPPAASAYYVLPGDLLKNLSTVGQVSAKIISALEQNGYVERSFYETEGGGVALVTRLERINDDGSSVAEPDRWSAGDRSTTDLMQFLRGLFFADPGHYRVIVFVFQDFPF